MVDLVLKIKALIIDKLYIQMWFAWKIDIK